MCINGFNANLGLYDIIMYPIIRGINFEPTFLNFCGALGGGKFKGRAFGGVYKNGLQE